VANARVDLIRRGSVRSAIVALNIRHGDRRRQPTKIVDNSSIKPSTWIACSPGEALRQRPEYRQARLRAAAPRRPSGQTFRKLLFQIFGSGNVRGTQPQLNEAWTLG